MEKSQARKLTQVNLQNISHARGGVIETDNGAYPVGETLITKELYKALSGDLSGNGEEPTEEIYWPDLLKKDSAYCRESARGQRIYSGWLWRSPFRYRSSLDIDGKTGSIL